MDTAQEALFKAMFNEGWFTQTDGDQDFPLGNFGWVHNHPSELSNIRDEFEGVLNAYGAIADEQIVGVWWASINSDGIIRITKMGDCLPHSTSTSDFNNNRAVFDAKKRFRDTERDFVDWANDNEEN